MTMPPNDLVTSRRAACSTGIGKGYMSNKNFKLSFRLAEVLLLVFELNLGLAGLVMVYSAFAGPAAKLYLPAQVLVSLLPGVMTVCYAGWLVYRHHCLARAKSRPAALLGATLLGFVAIGFGAAVGKLATTFYSDVFLLGLNSAIDDPELKRAGLGSLLAFLSIGCVFAVTFILRAGRGQWRSNESSLDDLHLKLRDLSSRVVPNWSEQLVPRIDALLDQSKQADAILTYQKAMGCEFDEASGAIADWPEQRLRLEVELLSNELQKSGDATVVLVRPIGESAMSAR